ncbi:hypothetical protein ACFPH6_23895 [Streptomyces xiangluensis]|uniref:Uncharacterized protein n=1 Tax=Streptomyces xiangluensis TaxID=2665720 RepID=A0ABV8YQK0_9ACTN
MTAGPSAVFVEVGSAEAFRHEDLASRLWVCGVHAELHVRAGGFHIFDDATSAACLSAADLAARSVWGRRTLGV